MRVQNALPAIVSKDRFNRVLALLDSRAPSNAHPRRSASTYLLSGLVKCRKCGKALTGQDSKGGKFAYYVCQSLLKEGRGACDAPRLNSKRFEGLIVDQIRESILTESNIKELVRLVDEEMDGVAREQRERLETIEEELADVRRRIERLWHVIETTDLTFSDASSRIRGHTERQERLETGCGGDSCATFRPACNAGQR